MKVSIQRSAQQWFFDREKVTRRIEAKRLRAMAKMGGFIRTTAQRSIRKGKTSSLPGQPPKSHTGLLKDQIWFAYDPAADSVVIGPVEFRNSGVPEALEFGGTVHVRNRLIVRQMKVGETPKGRDKFQRTVVGRYTGPLTIKARPFMGPALKTSKSALPDVWAKAMSK